MKTETIHLDTIHAELKTSVSGSTLILIGMRPNSRKPSWERNRVHVHIELNRWMPEYLVEMLADEMRFRRNEVMKDIHRFSQNALIVK